MRRRAILIIAIALAALAVVAVMVLTQSSEPPRGMLVADGFGTVGSSARGGEIISDANVLIHNDARTPLVLERIVPVLPRGSAVPPRSASRSPARDA